MRLEGCMKWCTGCAHALEALAAQVAEAISDDCFFPCHEHSVERVIQYARSRPRSWPCLPNPAPSPLRPMCESANSGVAD